MLVPGPETEEIKGSSGLRNEKVVQNTVPTFRALYFTCPRCPVLATHKWIDVYHKSTKIVQMKSVRVETMLEDVAISVCSACGQRSLWFEKQLAYPSQTISEPMPDNMPPELQKDFEEARAIAPISPRAAAALLRMCVEGLCKSITGEANFDASIKKLEAQGIPKQIAMAMDVVRLNGNEVLHAGKLYGEDNSATVSLLFGLVKNIVHWAITEKKQLEELYAQIPPEKRKHIEKRNASSKLPS